MAEDDILAGEVIDGVGAGVVVEDYPAYPKGPCTLVLQQDRRGDAIHVVWGIPRGQTSPDPARWTEDCIPSSSAKARTRQKWMSS